MSETEDTERPAGGAGRKPLTLKTTKGAGVVRQSFSHGRSKAVVVEKKKRRVITPKGQKAKTEAPDSAPAPVEPDLAGSLGLSKEELRRRQDALKTAHAQESEREVSRQLEEDARRQRENEDKNRLDSERRRAEEEAQAKASEQAALAAEANAAKTAATQKGSSKPAGPSAPAADRTEKSGGRLQALGGRVKKARSGGAPPAVSRQRGAPERRRRKLTIVSALDDEGGDRQRSIAALKRAREKERQRRVAGGEREKVMREVVIPESITVSELANRMTERTADVIRFLMKEGHMLRGDDPIEADTAELIVAEFGHTVRRVSEADVEEGFISEDDSEESKLPRWPVVAVMGHVDHGKTTLLDALRETDVVSGEAGGITQHIGAYQVTLKSGDKITFLDTPGHAAFSAMRMRGASAVDIVILVVAADDGVMPQTVEAINHARAAGAPIIVAVNKIDKPNANPQKVLQDLLQHEIVVEAMGGETQAIEVSAIEKTGFDALTEAITLQAELLELKANPDRSAEGVVVESRLDKGRGAVATVLVKRGTLKRGDLVVAGSASGKVRALVNERGQQVPGAGPSEPVEVLGLGEPPEPGEEFAVVDNEARARELTEYRDRKRRQQSSGAPPEGASLEQMMAKLKDKTASELVLVVKADVQGSAEAITQAVEKIGNDEVKARVLHQAVGGINESDVLLAQSTGAPLIAFNVRANKQARALAEQEGVEIRYYSIIYNVIDDIKAALEGMLAPEQRETFIGYADVLEVFNVSKVGKVAGCRLSEGVVKRGCGVRLLRDDVVAHEGKLATLKRFKDEVEEVKAGQECGMGFENYNDVQKGDRIECFTVTEVVRTLD